MASQLRNWGLLVLVIGFFGMSFFIFNLRSAEAAFGISPPFLNADHLVKGARYVQTVYLVQDQPNQDLKIKAELDINERVKSWFTVNNGAPIVIPKGVRQFPLDIVVEIPKNADLGVYSGFLSFSAAPTEGGQVAIALGVQMVINLTVGTNIYRNFSVPLVKFLDIEEGWAPKVYLKINNEGNVPESFEGATYELFDNFGAVRLAYLQKRKNLPEVPPFTVKDYVVEFPLSFHIGVGQYWGSVSFMKDDKVIANQRTIFNVLERGSLVSPSARILNFLKGNWGYLAGGLAVLLAIFAFLSIKKRRKLRAFQV